MNIITHFIRLLKGDPKVLEKTNFFLKNAYSSSKIIDPKVPKFQLNDFVRISKHKEIFSKGHTPNWSNEIFKDYKIVKTNPTTTKL